MNRQNALRLSHRSRIRLGLASGRSPDLRFVEPEQPSQNILQWPTSAQFSANTVAGQSRILTAFPNTRLCDLYRDAKERSNTTCGKRSPSRCPHILSFNQQAGPHILSFNQQQGSALQAYPTVSEHLLRPVFLQQSVHNL